MKKKEKKGFTLIELLATLAILAILVSIVIVFYVYNKKSVENTVSNVLYNNIITASNNYYSEFQKEFIWHKNKDGSETSCINLNSLIDKGIFPNDNSEFNKIKQEKIVIINRINDVNTYTLGDFNECIFWEIDSDDVVNNAPDYSIGGGELGGTNISQDIVANENEYQINLNFNTKNFEETVINNELYVAVALDQSGSMSGTAYTNAVNATKTLANSLISSVEKSYLGLILYESSAYVARGFEHKNFNNVNFGSASGGTNIASALSTAKQMLDSKKGDNISKVVVLLTDGLDSGYTSIANQLKNEGVIIITVGYDVSSNTLKSIASLNSKGEPYYYETGISNVEKVFKEIAMDIQKEVSDISKIKVEITPNSKFEIENISTNGTIVENTIVYNIDLSNVEEKESNVQVSYLAKLNYEYNDKEDSSIKIKFYDIKITIYKKDGSTEIIVPDDENIPYIDFVTKKVDTSKQ